MGLAQKLLRGLEDCFPFAGQRLNDHRLDQAHYRRGVGVVRAELAALVRIKAALEQRAED